MIIYKITNNINGKIYIGQTIGLLRRRWTDHCCKTTHCIKLYRAIQKYGRENFTVEEIDGANSQSELNYKEWLYIHKFNSLDRVKGYNLREGGGSRGKVSQETKDKISKAGKGRKVSLETRQKMSRSHKGRVHSVEARRKLSEAHKGKVISQETREKLSKAGKGRVASQETRKKISETSKGRGLKAVIRCDGKKYKSIKEAAEDIGARSTCVSAVARGRRRVVRGYSFKYL